MCSGCFLQCKDIYVICQREVRRKKQANKKTFLYTDWPKLANSVFICAQETPSLNVETIGKLGTARGRVRMIGVGKKYVVSLNGIAPTENDNAQTGDLRKDTKIMGVFGW